jgi:hypothetical protein
MVGNTWNVRLKTAVYFFTIICLGTVFAGTMFEQSNPIPNPKEIWERFQKITGPLSYTITGDEIILSETDPKMKLRRIHFTFSSQDVPYETVESGETRWEMKELIHNGVIFIPADPGVTNRPGRKGNVVIVGGLPGPYRQSFLSNYGEPIAVSTGYPTMVLPNPGELRDAPGREYSQGMLINYRRENPDLIHHSHFRWAVPFLRALDILAEVLKVDRNEIRAVIGGHSKRATSAYTAAAIDPERIAGIVFMGNESLHPEGSESPWWAVSPFYTRKFVKCPVLYIGATNESGYPMFNINRIQEHMDRPWTLEMIPNYRHASESEVQFIDWRMWVSHIFDGRLVTHISNLHHETTEKGTTFSTRIDTPNRIILAQAWYTHGDPSDRRNLVWDSTLLQSEGENIFEGFVSGPPPTIWFVEVQDLAWGFPGYVSSLPQDIRAETEK